MMGKLVWLIAALLLVTGVLYGVYRYAVATGGVALLERVDRLVGGTSGTRLALHHGRYGPLAAQRVEVVVPAHSAATPRLMVVFIHGGGWRSGRPQDYRFVGRMLARAGYVAVLPGYRLTPDGAFPHMLEDSAAAVAWARANASRFGGNPDRIVLAGQSAGAYNAVMLGLERQWLGRAGVPEGTIKGVIGLSGPYDFYPFTSESSRLAFGHVQPPEQTQPIRFVRGDAPPMLLLTGNADVTVKPRNTRVLAEALGALGAPVQSVIVPGASHEDTVLKLARPFARDSRVTGPMLAFLAARDRASAPVQPPVR